MIDKKQLDQLLQRGVSTQIATRFSVFQHCPNDFDTFSLQNLPMLLQCGHFMCQQCQKTCKKCAVCCKDIKIKQRNFKFFFQVMQKTTSTTISENPEVNKFQIMKQNEHLNIDPQMFQLMIMSEIGQINGDIDMQKFQSAYSELEKNLNKFISSQTQKQTKIRAAKEQQSLKMITDNLNHFQLLKEVQIEMAYCANVQVLFKMKNYMPTYHSRQVYFKLSIKNQEKFLQVLNQKQYFYYNGPYKIEPEQPCELVAHMVYYVQERLKEDGIMTCKDSPAFVRLDNIHSQYRFAPGIMAWIDLRKSFEDIIKEQSQLFQQSQALIIEQHSSKMQIEIQGKKQTGRRQRIRTLPPLPSKTLPPQIIKQDKKQNIQILNSPRPFFQSFFQPTFKKNNLTKIQNVKNILDQAALKNKVYNVTIKTLFKKNNEGAILTQLQSAFIQIVSLGSSDYVQLLNSKSFFYSHRTYQVERNCSLRNVIQTLESKMMNQALANYKDYKSFIKQENQYKFQNPFVLHIPESQVIFIMRDE